MFDVLINLEKEQKMTKSKQTEKAVNSYLKSRKNIFTDLILDLI